MNYLAHFQLSSEQSGFILGALLGDFIKGPLAKESVPKFVTANLLTEQILAGIDLHRKIDAFFDRQLQDLSLIEDQDLQSIPRFRRYLPIVLDLKFDYHLSLQWTNFEAQSLEEFSCHITDTLEKHQHHLTEAAQRMLQRFQTHSLLTRYHDKELLRGICESISNRFTHKNNLMEVYDAITEREADISEYFFETYPKMIRFVANNKKAAGSSIRHTN
jgi:acyl carrier protein phosphodiesterase